MIDRYTSHKVTQFFKSTLGEGETVIIFIKLTCFETKLERVIKFIFQRR